MLILFPSKNLLTLSLTSGRFFFYLSLIYYYQVPIETVKFENKILKAKIIKKPNISYSSRTTHTKYLSSRHAGTHTHVVGGGGGRGGMVTHCTLLSAIKILNKTVFPNK